MLTEEAMRTNYSRPHIYAKITKEKLNKDMDKLSLQLSHIDEYMGTEKGE